MNFRRSTWQCSRGQNRMSNRLNSILRISLGLAFGLLAGPALGDDDIDRLAVGLQKDGRIVVPTNQILKPAGKEITFSGRPVDLALAEDGRVLVVKNMAGLVFIDTTTAEIKQTLAVRGGAFSVVGL